MSAGDAFYGAAPPLTDDALRARLDAHTRLRAAGRVRWTDDGPDGRSSPYGAADDAAWAFPPDPNLPRTPTTGDVHMTTTEPAPDAAAQRDAALAEYDRARAENEVLRGRVDQLDREARVLRTQVAGLEHSRRRWRDRLLRRIKRMQELEAEVAHLRARTRAADAAEHFHGCPTPTGRPFDCDYCQARAASMAGA